ncbi:Endonuclease YncB, thermonuclease family [Anaerosphaera aminiphila DSM 21120]|uniref:Endonuclease YncB, thermonuclease family n=1 Tax=Anaerosphaera aminiphila DSM 21120 TaxID=1120995 RepID=A0A1M5S2K4_9FIRM|nr:thermonuclease family protein [Anaerosphaera aminiphila]SHH32837.1 Endonuclease YncB, thermonuclease family [Anaerosphaera aminiphila DSM 21120]
MKKSACFLNVVLILILSLFLTGCERENIKADYEIVTVSQVIDGDTIRTSQGEKIRLIGINTPESKNNKEEFGEEAYLYVRDLIEGKEVYLEEDISDRDKYDRMLRYVWLKEPEQIDKNTVENYNLSGILLKEGLAKKYTFEPDIKYRDYFSEIQDTAREEKIGMWSKDKYGATRGDRI